MAGPGSHWQHVVTSLYPHALTRTYCVPPIQFNRVPYVRDIVPGTGHSALVLLPLSGATPVPNAPPASQRSVPPSGAASVSNVPPVSQRSVPPSGAAPVSNVPPVSQRSVPPSGAAPVSNVPPVSQRSVPPSGAASVSNVPPASQRSVPPSGAAPVHIVLTPSQPPAAACLPSQYSLWTQESQPQAIPDRVQESDLRDDFAQNHVMANLQELGNSRHEAMFILSQLSFGNYLNQPAYAAAARQLPRPSQLDTKKTKYSDGEADFVLIHRQHGILIGELKSVGKNQACAQKPQPPADADVAKRVTKAVKQLDRSETVVRHLVSDVTPGLTVRKTLFLPYVSTEQLERILDNDPQLEQAVCRSLGAGYAAEAVQLCCCSDQLSQPASYWHVTPAVLSQLSTWWQHRMARIVDTLLSDDKYLDIVARFVGPATTVSVPCYNGVRVEVRTAGQAVLELGRRLALLVLTLQQLDLLNRDPRLVYLTGPPGTGLSDKRFLHVVVLRAVCRLSDDERTGQRRSLMLTASCDVTQM